MFTHEDDTPISYSSAGRSVRRPFYLPFSLKQRFSNELLLSAYTVVRSNCEEACSAKLLSDVSDELKQEYRNNTNISQVALKSRNDDLQGSLDSCVRRCFGK